MTRKISLLVLLCLSLVLLSATNCSAEQLYQISERQLSNLEKNNILLQSNNSKQLQRLSELKGQVQLLQQELATSKASLRIAQQSLSKMQEYIKQLEKADNSNPSLMFAVGCAGVDGCVLGLKYKLNKNLETAIIGNDKRMTAIMFVGL